MTDPATTGGQVYIAGWQKWLLASPRIPRRALLAAARTAARLMRRRIAARDRLDAERTPPRTGAAADVIYFADIYHGGATFWDWIVLRGGGLWWNVLWPLVVETTVDRLRRYPDLRAVLELDAHTYEELGAASIRRLRAAVASGRLEIANGTYAQPLAATIGPEANLRHFFYGVEAIERTLGAGVDSFVAGEPQFFPQLPQVLAGFGIRNAVLRTHWAPFGTDPPADAAVVRWQGPDGSHVRTVPRYSRMDYLFLKQGHPGVQNAGLTGDDFEQWTQERAAQFAAHARAEGIVRPFITRLADPKPPESPFPALIAAARRRGSRLLTVKEYFDLAPQHEPLVSYSSDDIPSTIPWGLAGEQLHREQVRAESALLVAERLDAIVQSLGMPGHQEQLDAAWKLLLRAQHHDLHLCSPWHSIRHGISMGQVGRDFARRGAQEAEAVAATALEALARRFGRRTGGGRTVLLFNPSPWPRRELVRLPTDGAVEVWRGNTEQVAQMVRGRGAATAVAFTAQLPPLGMDIVELRPASRDDARPPTPVGVAADALGLAGLDVQGAYLTVCREGRWQRSQVARIDLEYDGPVLRQYTVRGRLRDLSFTQSVTAIPALRRVELVTEVDFGSGRHLGPQLSEHRSDVAYYVQDDKKLCLAFTARLPQLCCDSPFLLGEPRGPRFTALSFVGLTGPEGGGVAVLHKGTPGWHADRSDGVLLRNVLAWAPEQWLYASDDSVTPGRSRYTAVRGTQRYEHAVVAIDTQLDAVRAAHDSRLPLLAVDVAAGEGGESLPWSFLDVAPEHVVLTALFARNGHTYARLWNASARAAEVTRLASAGAVSLRLEAERASAWPRMRPWGIQTVRVEPRFTS